MKYDNIKAMMKVRTNEVPKIFPIPDLLFMSSSVMPAAFCHAFPKTFGLYQMNPKTKVETVPSTTASQSISIVIGVRVISWRGEAMEEGRQMQALNRRLTLHGDGLDEDQRRRIIEIADKCPVHKTLEGELHVHTEEVR